MPLHHSSNGGGIKSQIPVKNDSNIQATWDRGAHSKGYKCTYIHVHVFQTKRYSEKKSLPPYPNLYVHSSLE